MTQLRDRLADLAETVEPDPAIVTRAVAHGRRRRRAQQALTPFLVMGLVIAVLLAGPRLADLTRPQQISGAGTDSNGLLDWSPRGDLVKSGDLIARAVDVWQQSEGRHGHIRTLFAGTVAGTALVVLEGLSPTAGARVGVITGAIQVQSTGVEPRPTGVPLYFRSDIAVPTGDVEALGFASNHAGSGEGQLSDHDGSYLVFGLAAPGADDIVIASTAVDDSMTADAGSRGKDSDWMVLPATAVPQTDSMTVYRDGASRSVGVQMTGVGDIPLQRATVTSEGRNAVRIDATSARVGDWVLTANGLIGRVSNVDGAGADVELVDSPQFSASLEADVSDAAATGTGTGQGVMALKGLDNSKVAAGTRMLTTLHLMNGDAQFTVGTVTTVNDYGVGELKTVRAPRVGGDVFLLS